MTSSSDYAKTISNLAILIPQNPELLDRIMDAFEINIAKIPHQTIERIYLNSELFDKSIRGMKLYLKFSKLPQTGSIIYIQLFNCWAYVTNDIAFKRFLKQLKKSQNYVTRIIMADQSRTVVLLCDKNNKMTDKIVDWIKEECQITPIIVNTEDKTKICIDKVFKPDECDKIVEDIQKYISIYDPEFAKSINDGVKSDSGRKYYQRDLKFTDNNGELLNNRLIRTLIGIYENHGPINQTINQTINITFPISKSSKNHSKTIDWITSNPPTEPIPIAEYRSKCISETGQEINNTFFGKLMKLAYPNLRIFKKNGIQNYQI